MKRVTPWLAILLLGGVPLTAAAFDYGPNQPLLAADTGSPQLPGAPSHTSSASAIAKPDVMTPTSDDTAEAGTPAATLVAAPHPGPTARAPGASASNRAHARTAHPVPAPTASWQSLLPGSIQ